VQIKSPIRGDSTETGAIKTGSIKTGAIRAGAKGRKPNLATPLRAFSIPEINHPKDENTRKMKTPIPQPKTEKAIPSESLNSLLLLFLSSASLIFFFIFFKGNILNRNGMRRLTVPP
jgi:hypothetical protein